MLESWKVYFQDILIYDYDLDFKDILIFFWQKKYNVYFYAVLYILLLVCTIYLGLLFVTKEDAKLGLVLGPQESSKMPGGFAK